MSFTCPACGESCATGHQLLEHYGRDHRERTDTESGTDETGPPADVAYVADYHVEDGSVHLDSDCGHLAGAVEISEIDPASVTEPHRWCCYCARRVRRPTRRPSTAATGNDLPVQ